MRRLWVLSRNPLPGKEDELEDVGSKLRYCRRKLSRAYASKSIERWRARVEKYKLKQRQLTLSPSDDFGTPRIGVDAKGTEWFRQYYERMRGGSHARYWQLSFEELLPLFQGESIPDYAFWLLPLNWHPGCLYDLSFDVSTSRFLYRVLNISESRSAESLRSGYRVALEAICSQLRQCDNGFVGMTDEVVLGRWHLVHGMIRDDPSCVLSAHDSLLVTAMNDEAFRICYWMQFWGLRGFDQTMESFND